MVIIVMLYGFVVLEKGYTELEQRQAGGEAGRAIALLDDHNRAVDAILRDYASWNETYDFAIDHSPAYLEVNLAADLYQDTEIDVMEFFDRNGQFIAGAQLNSSTDELETIDPVVQNAVYGAEIVQETVRTGKSTVGYIGAPSAPLMVVAEPILHNDDSGPVGGAMLMITLLDESTLTRFSDLFGRPLRLASPSQVAVSPPRAADGFGAARLNASVIAGLAPLADIRGNPIGLLSVELPRDIYKNGMESLTSFLFSSLLIGAVFSGLALAMIDRQVLRRMHSIIQQVERIRSSGTHNRIEGVTGDDELTGLADSINAMVTEITSANHRYQSLAETAKELNVVISPDRKVAYMNPAAEAWFGMPWRPSLSLTDLVPAHGDELFDEALLAANQQRSLRRELRFEHENDLRILDATIIPAINEEGNVNGLTMIARDVTEQRRREEERLRLVRLETLGAVAASVSHQFNNLMTIVQGNLMLARQVSGDPETTQRFLSIAEEAVARAQIETNKLVTFAHGGEPILQQIPIQKVIGEAVRVGVQDTGGEVGVVVDAPALTITVDRRQLVGALSELIRNAREATPDQGNVTVRVSTTVPWTAPAPGLPPGEYVEIAVSDTGKGIPESIRDRVFEVTCTTKEAACGIGLPLARSVARKHGGEVVITMSGPEGTTVSVLLPIRRMSSTGTFLQRSPA
ncbi:MAG: CHASE4 domain-containing protein [Methanospirillum sp.]